MELSKQNTSLQDDFIKKLCEEKIIVHIFLTNGIKLEGYISNSDDYTILLEGKAKQLVFKRAISTIMLAGSTFSPNKSTSTGSKLMET